ncbi:class I SAM-dependent methyltransferase [Ktedonobacter sp. SOSP1-52]|uniref:class I SAM-dependent methyltransferase n=1 Tax=Ktedonobacter sp. SOSP1-52 TaxID=2778366 RepID=UPI0019168612|nr:class I SAM-dependent methyltransferase [Ktedonobacter sp. SOSP1-52]
MGCDLVEQTTEKSFKQPNYRFVEADVLKGLPFRDRSFDFVHQRLLFLAIPAHAWPSELLELVRVARPGGWIELVESEIQARNAGPATQRMGQWIIEVSKRRGIDSSQVPHLGTYLKNAGLQNVVTRSVTVPMGQWGGRVGSMMAANINSAYQAMKPLITSQLGISPEAYEKNILLQHQEWEERHPASVFYAAYGQRPH